MRHHFQKYLVIVFSLAVLGLGLAALVVWLVDPYDNFGRNWTGFYFQTERQNKHSILGYPHDAILIGSSRTLHINPDDLCGYKFFNASFASGLPEEFYFFLKKYVTKEKLVALGLDFYMFNENEYPLITMSEWPEHYWQAHEYLWGANVFVNSLQAVYFWLKHRPGTPVNGFSPLINDAKPDQGKYNGMLKHLANKHYRNFRFSEQRFEYLRQLKRLLDERGVGYLVFVNPMQEDNWAVLRASGSEEIFVDWLMRLKEIFPDVKFFPPGQFSQRDMYHNSDPSHYLPAVGAAFINQLTGCNH